MNNFYSLFYWITVSDGVKHLFDVSSNFFTALTFFSFVALVITSVGRSVSVSENDLKNENEEKTNSEFRAWESARKLTARLFYPFVVLMLITWLGYMMTPTKKDCLLIVAGGAVGNFLTSDTSAKSIPSDITAFLHQGLQNEINSMKDSTKKDIEKQLGLGSPKDKFIEKAKAMTKEQLIQYLENDSTLVK